MINPIPKLPILGLRRPGQEPAKKSKSRPGERGNVQAKLDEALKSNYAPDIVLLDLAMPELSGAATLKELRKDWGQMPVIIHTAFADGDLMKQALASLKRRRGGFRNWM